MATYNAEIRTLNRTVVRENKRSYRVGAANRLAYRTGQILTDYEGKTAYPRRAASDVLWTGMWRWNGSVQDLSDAVEASESRKKSRLLREAFVSLPRELSADQRSQLVSEISAEVAKRWGVAVLSVIHKAPRGGENHHAHICWTTRTSTGFELKEKTRILDCSTTSGPEVEWLRERVEAHVNSALGSAGSKERVDRSYYRGHPKLSQPEYQKGRAGQYISARAKEHFERLEKEKYANQERDRNRARRSVEATRRSEETARFAERVLRGARAAHQGLLAAHRRHRKRIAVRRTQQQRALVQSNDGPTVKGEGRATSTEATHIGAGVHGGGGQGGPGSTQSARERRIEEIKRLIVGGHRPSEPEGEDRAEIGPSHERSDEAAPREEKPLPASPSQSPPKEHVWTADDFFSDEEEFEDQNQEWKL